MEKLDSVFWKKYVTASYINWDVVFTKNTLTPKIT